MLCVMQPDISKMRRSNISLVRPNYLTSWDFSFIVFSSLARVNIWHVPRTGRQTGGPHCLQRCLSYINLSYLIT